MNKCPKCSSRNISGPVFSRGMYGQYGERLIHTCGNCGYVHSESTHDAKSSDHIANFMNICRNAGKFKENPND